MKRVPTMVLSATPGLWTGPMTISGYAWGHIVASGPRQLGRDIRVVDTHPRPLYLAQKQLTVSAATGGNSSGPTKVSVVARLGRWFHFFRLKQFLAFPNP